MDEGSELLLPPECSRQYLEDAFKHEDSEELDAEVAALATEPVQLGEGHQVVVV